MNWKKIMAIAKNDLTKKYGAYVLLLIGLVLMFMVGVIDGNEPIQAFAADETTAPTYSPQPYTDELQILLKKVLSQMAGVGAVDVAITVKGSAQTVLAEDKKTTENANGGTVSNEEKVVTIANSPVVLQEISPEIEGVVVVAEGANSPQVVLNISQAVTALTGVKANKIGVFPMKNAERVENK